MYRLLISVSVMFCLWSLSAMANVPATQVRSFHLDAPVSRVFPLFTALGERAWARGWEPELLSGREERGSVFRTVHGGHETVWIVVDYSPSQGHASYARLTRDSNIGLVDVHCEAGTKGGTDVSVRYTLTGLNDRGQAFVSDFLDPRHYDRMIEEWRVAISAALAVAPHS